MVRTTISRAEVLKIVANCVGNSGRAALISALADRPEWTSGPPINGALVTHLFAFVMGDPGQWKRIVAIRHDLASVDPNDIASVIRQLFSDRSDSDE